MLTPNEIRTEVGRAVAAQLSHHGFVRRRSCLLPDRGAAVTDWVGLGTSVPDRGGPVWIWVNIGVHCGPLHRAIADLTTEPYDPTVPTFAQNLGYLTSAKTFGEWPFDREVFDSSQVTPVVDALQRFGIPFLETFVTLESVRLGCESYGLRQDNLLLVPLLLHLEGKTTEAIELLRGNLDAMVSRSDAAADWFRVCAHKLLSVHSRTTA